MPGPPAKHRITLTAKEHRRLEETARSRIASVRDVLRARIVLLAAKGGTNHEISRSLRCALQTVKTWRKRFAESRLNGLHDQPRSGRPPLFPSRTLVEIKAIACELPAKRGLPLSRFSLSEILGEIQRAGVHPVPSRSALWSILRESGIRPWFHRSWVFRRDPRFAERAGPILDLYEGRWNGEPLGPEDHVLCADEKTGIQVLSRPHPTEAPGPGKQMRVEFEYRRHGTIGYTGAVDVRSGRAFGACPSRNTRITFRRFVKTVMAREPYASARRVFWIVDNGSAHHPTTFGPWLSRACPNAVAVHTPVHASWLNQEEIFLSILDRKALTPRDLSGRAEAIQRILRFQERYNRNCRPFRWRFTRRDLRRLLREAGEEADAADAKTAPLAEPPANAIRTPLVSAVG